MNPHFFGDSRSPLFGVHHPARARGDKRAAVLLCPPIGHEYIRTHWAMRMLAAQLARQGHHVLRFDYRGVGDSSGTLSEVTQLATWVEDVRRAATDLVDESSIEELYIVGLRFGAAVASLAIAEGLPVTHAVYWEPIWSGEEYLADLRVLHATMLDLWVCPMTTVDDDQHEEILGSVYTRSLLSEIQEYDLTFAAEQSPLAPTLVTGKSALQTLPGSQMVIHDEPGDWHDLAMIETAWLPSGSLGLIADVLQQPEPVSGQIPVAPIIMPVVPGSERGTGAES